MLRLASALCFVAACGASAPSPAPPPPAPVPEASGSAAAKLECAASGGQCVPTSPNACTTGTVGDVSQYSCGGGQECCLPKK